jgi:chromate reductase
MTESRPITILAISGSLKSTSANTSILRNIADIASLHIVIRIFEGLDSLPHFNPETK